ncbi:MAG: NAD(P)H-hydrate dehydratase [Actinobacteria bacterium]|nr:NAD(P)H-hydrate dehydratase [Actinomycetota bacterium]NDA53739.1 NAD(P)H-hydrate dehydratase [Actinomycetota bacterium]
MGRLLVIAGSYGMAGAAALSAEAAMRSGCGYVYVATAACNAPQLTAAVPSAILRHSMQRNQTSLRWDDLPMLFDAMRVVDAVVIGPGLGDVADEWLGALLERLAAMPTVFDADALNALARRRELLALLTSCHIVTPHAGEAARLLGWGNDAERVNTARHSAISELCTATRAVAVLKGADTLVAQRGAPTVVNPTGNAGLAKAGSGDVLSGVIGALLARGMRAHDAAVAGTWIHGRAADVLASEVGEDAYISSDLARALGRAFNDYGQASLEE